MTLAAELRFQAAGSADWATLRSDSDGKFEGFLPGEGGRRWTVRVRAERPRAARTFRDLNIDGDGSIDLVLPVTTVAGRVTSVDGSVVWPATVNLRNSSDGLLQSTVERDGSFEVQGLSNRFSFSSRRSASCTAA